MDIENQHLQYNRPLLYWWKNFNEHIEEVWEKLGIRFVRMWELYQASCVVTFHNGIIDLYQIYSHTGLTMSFRW